MRAKKTKPVAKKKSVRQKSKAATPAPARAAAAVDEALPGVVALVPDRARRHATYNGLVLLAAIVTLTIIAGSAALPSLFGSADIVEKRLDAAVIDREIARAVAEAGYVDELSLPVAPPAQEAKSENPEPRAEAAVEAKAEARAEPKPETKEAAKNKAKPRSKAQRRLERHKVRDAAAGLDALASASTGSDLIAEARKYLGGNPTGRRSEWCGAFLDMVLKRTGHRGGGNLARGYIKYGTRVAGPEVGAIVVLSRPGGGHVGIVTGVDSNGNPIVISGNHNRRVAVATYPASRVIAYVRPDS